MTVVLWNYTLVLRTKNSAGAVLHTWTPQTAPSTGLSKYARPKRIGPPTYEPIVEERELVNRSRRPYLVGYRAHLVLEWEVVSYAIGWESLGGTTLYTLLNDLMTAGAYLEVSLNNGSYYKRMNIVNSIDYQMPEGKAVSLGLTLELEGADLQATVPNGVLCDSTW